MSAKAAQDDRRAPLRLEISFSPDRATELPALEVDLTIDGHRGEALRLIWPSDWLETDIRSHLRVVRVERASGGDLDVDQEHHDPATMLLHPAGPSEPVSVRYSFEKGERETGLAWHPTIERDQIHFMGHTVLPRICVAADCDLMQPIEAEFDWSAYDGIGLATWSQGKPDSNYSGPINGILESIYAIGAVDLQSLSIEGEGQATLSTTLATFSLTAAEQREAAAAVQSAMEAVLRFWRDVPTERFLVTLRKPAARRDYALRSGFDANDSLALMSAGDDALRGHEFRTLVAHEFTHRWLDAELFADPRGKRLFHEGFTDFVARQVIWRQGLMSFETYSNEINDVLRDYFGSWLHHAPEADLVEFGGQSVSYRRGELLAHAWAHRLAHRDDRRLKPLSKEALRDFDLPIDRFIRTVVDAANGDGTLTLEHIYEVGRLFNVTDIEDDVQRLSNGDGSIEIDSWFGPCAVMGATIVRRPDLGLDVFLTSRTGVVVNLDPEGPAAKAGLLEGDVVIRWSLDGSGDVVWEIMRDDQSMAFTYAARQETIDMPQFRAKNDVEIGANCFGQGS